MAIIPPLSHAKEALATCPHGRHHSAADRGYAACKESFAVTTSPLRRPFAVAAALALAASPAWAAPARHGAAHPAARPAPAPAPSGPPHLLVAVSIDQFSADLFAQYRQHYTGGLARLLQGAVFPSAFQSHAATETCPGHSTLLTGVHPSRSGIVANTWYDLSQGRADKRVYCAENEKDPASTPGAPVVSAGHLRVPTLGERMKEMWPESRNVAVSAKDRAVAMMGGSKVDAAYWITTGFVTYKGRELSPAAQAANAALGKLVAAGAPGLAAPAWCAPRSRGISASPLLPDQAKLGPLVVGTGNLPLPAKAWDALRANPRVDAATLDLASRLVAEMKLGQGKAPDMLSVSLSATDYIGHAYGTEGLEMCTQMAQLDASLGAFFARLDAMGIDYAVVLSADHGGLDLPERLDQQGLPGARRADPALMPAALSKAIAASLGLKDAGQLVYGEGPFGEFYVTRALPEDQRARVVGELVARLRTHDDVAAVFTRAELAVPPPRGNPQDWTLLDRARASYDPERSGDVVALLKRAVVPIPAVRQGYTATHGSPWDYDRRVPLLFWRRGVAGLEQPAPVETVDIAPTLAALIGLKVPEGAFDGRCLDIDGGPGDSCAGPK
ncbi:MAG: alkaline phosphatase family protein [Proteobacteria bacterium]|nr:alkaline phosphatase family protein [Pseudomonadota bacterium]